MSANGRLAVGVGLLAVGAILPLGAVLVYETDWPPVLKSALTGLLFFGLGIAAVAAVATMGKESFDGIVAGLKRCIGSFTPARNIGPTRHAIGIVLFLAPIPPTYIMAYLSAWMPDNSPQRFWVILVTDIAFEVSLFVLGGDFWDKLRSLFVREARASFPAQPNAVAKTHHESTEHA